MTVRKLDRDELKALVEQARNDPEFPGYFNARALGVTDPAYRWVDADGFLRLRDDLAAEYEAELDYTGVSVGLVPGELLGGAMRRIDPYGFDVAVMMHVGRLEAQGVLIPVRHG